MVAKIRRPLLDATTVVVLILVAGTGVILTVVRKQPPAPPAPSTSLRAFHDCALDRYTPIRISDFFIAGNALRSAKPVYPRDAHAKGIGVQVAVRVLINLETGSVEKACAYSGPPELWLPAEQAAVEWRFRTPQPELQRGYAHDFLIFDFVRSN